MAQRNPRYDLLFEPDADRACQPHRTASIRPLTPPAWATPSPKASAALRAVKAEGGWGVVCTDLLFDPPQLR